MNCNIIVFKKKKEGDQDFEAEAIDEDLDMTHEYKSEFQEFNVILEYLQTTGEILSFKNFPKYLFPNYDAFINTCKVFLDHKVNQERQNITLTIDDLQHKLLQNGVVAEQTFSHLFCNQNPLFTLFHSEREFVSYDIFKEFLFAMGMATKCFIGNTSEDQKSTRKNKGPMQTELFHENDADNLRTGFLIIPSLISRRDERGISLSQLYNQYNFEYNYRICYKFGEDTCLASLGLIELFLVQMFADVRWNLEFLKYATCFKEPIEMRKPGKVFSIDFSLKGKPQLAIIEEETPDAGSSFSDTRIITIYSNAAEDLNNLMKSAMRQAYEKLRLGYSAPQPEVSHIQSILYPII